MTQLQSFILVFILLLSTIYTGIVEKNEKEIIYKGRGKKLWVIFPENLHNGDTVELCWAGISNSTIKDEIKLFCPTTLEDTKILRVLRNKEFPEIGNSSGRITLQVFYERADCDFRYFSKVNQNVN